MGKRGITFTPEFRRRVVEPVRAGQLSSRMSHDFSFGPFRLYQATRVLKRKGTAVSVGSRAFDILIALVEQRGKVLSRRELMAIAWPQLVVDESNVRAQIAKLRRTLGCGRGSARYIANVAGRGYCFVAEVKRTSTEHPRETSDVVSASKASNSLANVPQPLNEAIGRENCVAELVQVLMKRRLVTIVGPGGAGKTTLAILVAHALDGFDDAIFFVDLSAVSRDDLIVEALASAVGHLPSGADILPGLMEVLSARKALVILDNCEHLIAGVAVLCQKIIEGTRNVSFLNTSREALRVRGEFVHLLSPLASPPDTGLVTAREAMSWPAVQLFMERSREGGARAVLSDDEASTVAALCRRLDGNPHAIELVASRVSSYGIHGVAELFERQFALHWQGRRASIPRHQTVEALIEWSHDLLLDRDRQVLYRLSVFSGTFSLEAAAAVTSDDQIDPTQVAEAIGDLVDKSLVAVSLEHRETHRRLLDTTRAYAASRLAKLPLGQDFARRHAQYYARRLREYGDRKGIPLSDARVRTPELSNVREAIDWAFTEGHDAALAAEMCRVAAPLFLELGLIRECKRICERAMRELPEQFRSTQVELDLLDCAAIAYYSGGDYEGAMKQVVERGLEIALQLGNSEARFHFLAGLHLATMANGEFEKSLSVSRQYASAALASGGPTELIVADWMEGSSRHYSGDPVSAEVSYDRGTQFLDARQMRSLHYFEKKQRIIASIGRARVKWALGMPKQALQIALNAIDDGRTHPDSFYMCVTLCFSVLLGNGLHDQAEELVEELENVAIDYKVAVRRQVIHVLKGQLLLAQGRYRDAIDHLCECLAMLPPPKMSVVRTDALQSLAEAHLKSGDAPNALVAIDEALHLAEKTAGTFNLADLLRTKAEVMMSLPHVAKAEIENTLLRAMDCSRKQRARGCELRVALAATRFHASEEKTRQAREALKLVYSEFTEGFDTNDLKAAAQALQLSVQ